MRRVALATVAVVACGGPATPAAPTPADQLGWLVGDWVDETDELKTAERWVALPGGDLLGLGSVHAGPALGFAEALTIRATPDGIAYIAWPVGQDPVAFPAERLVQGQAVFVNPEHDFPQRITYTRPDATTLKVEATGAGDRTERWSLTKAR